MSETLTYNGYDGSVEYSAKDRLLHGRLLGIRDTVTYEGLDVISLDSSFQSAVDEYLALCAETGRAPDRPFRGSFSVRTGVELDGRAAIFAEQHALKLNNVVKDALESYLNPDR